MLFEALHNTSGVQKASGYFLDGVQALSWVVDGLREDWLAIQVVNHIGDAYRNFLDATIEIDKTMLSLGHQLHKEIAKLNKINAALETQRQHTVLLQAESSFQVVANQARALAKSGGEDNQELEYESTLQEDVENRETKRTKVEHETCTKDLYITQRAYAENTRTALEREALAFALRMTHALERDACVLDQRIAKRKMARDELEVLRDGFINCMMHIGKYGVYIRDTLDMMRELTLLIMSLCGLSVHFDSLLGNCDNGIVAQQVQGLMSTNRHILI